eukprot:g3499.t1
MSLESKPEQRNERMSKELDGREDLEASKLKRSVTKRMVDLVPVKSTKLQQVHSMHDSVHHSRRSRMNEAMSAHTTRRRDLHRGLRLGEEKLFLRANWLRSTSIGQGIVMGIFGLFVIAASSFLFASANEEGRTTFEYIWSAYTFFIDPGSHTDLESYTTDWEIVIAVWTSVLGYTFLVVVIGYMTDFLIVWMQTTRAKYARLLLTDHVLVLGWSSKTLFLVQELAETFSGDGKTTIVLMSKREKHEMELDIEYNFPTKKSLNSLKVICWKGDPIDETDLLKVCVHSSRSVVVLSGHGNKVDQDQKVVRAVMCLAGLASTSQSLSIVAEVGLRENISVIKRIASKMASPILGRDLIDHVLVKMTMEPILALIIEGFLGFFGMPINVVQVSAANGLLIKNLRLHAAFRKVIICGVKCKGRAMKMLPKENYRILDGDRLVLIGKRVDISFIRGLTPEDLNSKEGVLNEVLNECKVGMSKVGEGATSLISRVGEGATSRTSLFSMFRKISHTSSKVSHSNDEQEEPPLGKFGSKVSFGENLDYVPAISKKGVLSEVTHVKNLVLIGWNEVAALMLKLLDADRKIDGLTIHIVNTIPESKQMSIIESNGMKLRGIKIKHYFGSPLMRQTFSHMRLDEMDTFLLLSEYNLPAIDADSRNITSLLLINDVLNDPRMRKGRRENDLTANKPVSAEIHSTSEAKQNVKDIISIKHYGGEKSQNNKNRYCHVVCELLDQRSMKMVQSNRFIKGAAKFAPTNALVTSLFATIVESPGMAEVLQNLVINQDTNLELMVIDSFAAEEELSDDSGEEKPSLSFYDLAARLRKEGHVLLGFLGDLGNPIVNPTNKETVRSWKKGELLIVMTETSKEEKLILTEVEEAVQNAEERDTETMLERESKEYLK